MRIRWVAFVGAALFPLFGCATGENPEAAVDRGVVSVDGGSIRGVAGGERADVWMYRGIPYAAPPLGMGRWRPLAPVTPWEGVRDATTFSPACVQNRRPSESFYGPGADAMSEDCLYLNVWTTATPEERKPVMVWVHGGGLRNGTGAQVTYDGSALARRGVVVVTLNYRLGPFGYLAHPLLTAESANNASGNYGVLDQIAALQWVQRNIDGFGGDPDRVTIFGESAGSWSVHTLVATPLAAGLFRGAIGQSGGVFGSFGGTPSLASGEAGGERFASSLLGDKEVTLEAMRAATSDEVLTAMTTDSGPIPLRPVVDGWVLPNTVYAIFAAGEQNDVPVIVGSNADEGTALTGGAGPRTVEEYRQFARQFGAHTEDFLAAYPATSEAEVRKAFLDSYTDRSFGWEMRTWARMQRPSDAFLYFFSRVAPAADADQYGAFHAAEIIYVFNNLGRSPHRYANRDYDDTDQRVADLMASYWVNFATTGNPTAKDYPRGHVTATQRTRHSCLAIRSRSATASGNLAWTSSIGTMLRTEKPEPRRPTGWSGRSREEGVMNWRCLVVSCVVVGVVSLLPVTATAQNRPTSSGAPIGISGLLAPADSATLPVTPWGDPDLQGVWNNSTRTPLERLTDAERERGRVAQAPVRRATAGTGAAWIEQAGGLDRASLVVDPPDGRIPKLRPEAVQRLVDREDARRGRGEGDSWLDRNSWERCISRTLPIAMIPNIYNANYQILQTPDWVVIVMEMIHEARIIPLDGRPHVSGGIRQWLGDSRGRWEGDTLVVDTVRFNNRLDGGDYQPSHIIQTGHRGPGGTLRLVERFRLIDPNTIDYQFTVEDPKTFTRPYTVALPMKRRDTTDPLNHLFEYACHEGNHAMVNLLTGARADEQAALEAAARVSQQRIDAGHPGIREPAVPILPVASQQ